MTPARRPPSLVTVVLLGLLYSGIGVGFGRLANSDGPEGMRAWRLAAWIVSGLVYGGHIGYERLRLDAPLRSVALRAALAAALGSFFLAVAANVHSARLHVENPRLLLALLAWP